MTNLKKYDIINTQDEERQKSRTKKIKKIKKVLDKQKKMCYNYLVRNKETNKKITKKEVLEMSEKNEKKLTKKEIYEIVTNVFEGKVQVADISADTVSEVLARMSKDTELASKVGTKKETENDRLNKDIQDTIVATLTEKGTMVYADLVKEVQAVYEGVSAQKVTANVTKIKDLVEKFEDGKGKAKKLYIKLV